MEDLAVVKEFLKRHEAEMARDLLLSSGIEGVVVADDCGGCRPHMLYAKAAKLLIKKEDLAKAKEILGDI
ncbi:MAG: hypothetical protein PHQ96_08810 [Candidatus Omnitrophica bacterium]|nr:hypothetical protein [Candidatus Omnitrophota bacterium]